MSGRLELSRRSFVASLLALFGLGAAAGCRPPYDAREVARELTGFLPSSGGWRELGRAYLRTRPDERSLAFLTERIVRDLGWSPPQPAPGPVQELIRTRIRDEFESGEVVRIQGWVLATTEARLAALLAVLG